MSSDRTIPQTQLQSASRESAIELLKAVLENLDSPECLEDHPWARSRMVKDICAETPGLSDQPVGDQLAAAVTQIFQESLPPAPPRQGKRLDTRWAQFGLLAARYFAPFVQGHLPPGSLREAWHGMDEAILAFTFNGHREANEAERARYRLTAAETEVAPESTLSDWHRGGIEKLAASIERRAKRLDAPNITDGTRSRASIKLGRVKTTVALLTAAVLLVLIVFGTLKARRVYDLALVVWEDAGRLKTMASKGISISSLRSAGPELSDLRRDFGNLKAEVQPFLPLGKWLRWVPVYGGDLGSAEEMFMIAEHVLGAAETSYAALTPLTGAMDAGQLAGPPQAVAMLAQAGPELSAAREDLEQAANLRAGIDVAGLSPRVRGLMEQYLDPLLPRLQDGLDVALALPGFMGATSEGPKTYLLLAQNEDELRATGGFITAAGNLVVKDGEILSLSFKDSGLLDNWAMPYPPSPWQLEAYMNSTVLLLRDSNWFTDFPVAAEYAEYLYSYASSHSVDGVIAFDQHSLVMLLQMLGPVQMEGQDEYIDASNVLTYMREARADRPADGIYPEGWNYKNFIGEIAPIILHRLYSTGPEDWQPLVQGFLNILNEKHLLVQADDARLSRILAKYGWNGAVTAGTGDFLMVVDTNVGFNKTNAAIEQRFFYDVNLANLLTPTGSLTSVHINRNPSAESCHHWDKTVTLAFKQYPVDDCYWNYLRVYAPEGAALLDSATQDIPAAWMIQGEAVPARVDLLDDDEPAGLQAFGTMLVVPGGQSIQTGFEYTLPPSVLIRDDVTGQVTYRLTVKKQPGTVAIPITIRLHLPAGAKVEFSPQGAVVEGKDLLLTADLRRDLLIEVVFSTR